MLIRGYDNALLTINLLHLEELEQLLDEVELLWSNRLNFYEIEGQKITDDDERQNFFDHYYDDWVVYRDTFPRTIRYSLLVSAYSFLERKSHEYYHSAKDKYGFEEIVDGEYCYNYINWFRKYFGKQIFSKQDFKRFNEINQLRNRIAHSNGVVDENKNKGLMQIIEQSTQLSLNQLDEIEITTTYIKESIKVISNMIESIHQCVYENK